MLDLLCEKVPDRDARLRILTQTFLHTVEPIESQAGELVVVASRLRALLGRVRKLIARMMAVLPLRQQISIVDGVDGTVDGNETIDGKESTKNAMRKQCDSDRSCRSPHHQQANFVESTSSLSSGHPAQRWALPGIQGVILTDRKYEISRKLRGFFGMLSANNFRVRWQVYKQVFASYACNGQSPNIHHQTVRSLTTQSQSSIIRLGYGEGYDESKS